MVMNKKGVSIVVKRPQAALRTYGGLCEEQVLNNVYADRQGRGKTFGYGLL
jgi:hypothetical protein